ncbi:tRNA (guanosine(37)-N1)-methyltransferase TrmD [Candidatus Aerophobetes bacterium]|uniref:tRNA (guanine-N(1)-)-methyltransferase n=1 Tax=Aerophobetes bacterium TaxID=2030807 RepID=A0A2A4YHS4_UNCAE|nr:MAG: tRNA (guanosine(37)-N1)-methyltransferase TrmD [Candidatus Aerophobetes bacterium]
MKYSILSLFPEYFRGPFDVSMIKRARDNNIISIDLVNIRDFADDKHHTVDDRPYGGGPGMVLKPGPVVKAIRNVKTEDSHVIYLSPQGKPLTAEKCRELSLHNHLILLCGHYEGIDERIIDIEVDEEVSIGSYVLTSGAPAAVVLVDSVTRFLPNAIGHPDAVKKDSYEEGIFDNPHYTRPSEFEGLKVPEVLLGGHHEEIEKWRSEMAKAKTKEVRPDLIEQL